MRSNNPAPLTSPLPSASCLSLSLPVCCRPSLLTGQGIGVGKKPNQRPRESLVLYKLFNTLYFQMLKKTTSLFIILSYSQDRLLSLTFCREKTRDSSFCPRKRRFYSTSTVLQNDIIFRTRRVGGVGERVGRGKGGEVVGSLPPPLTQKGDGWEALIVLIWLR